MQLVDARLQLRNIRLERRNIGAKARNIFLQLPDLRGCGAELLLRVDRVFSDQSVKKFDIALKAAGAFVESAGLGAILHAGNVLRLRRVKAEQCRAESESRESGHGSPPFVLRQRRCGSGVLGPEDRRRRGPAGKVREPMYRRTPPTGGSRRAKSFRRWDPGMPRPHDRLKIARAADNQPV